MQMPTATGTHHLTPEDAAVTMASRLVLRRRRDVPAFLLAALRLRRRFRSAPGSVRLDLAARPLARTFFTLSTWDDERSIRRYTADPVHREVMRTFGPRLVDSGFVTWTEGPGGELASWEEAHDRLGRAGSGFRP